MVRAIDNDFESLKEYVETYSLQEITGDAKRLSILKMGHKEYLPFLQFWALCADAALRGEFLFYSKTIGVERHEFNHLREAVSDIGSGLFCCLHGAYKPGHMALRSSIENYLRFSAGVHNKAALSTTSVYELFRISRETRSFADSRLLYLNKLRNQYVDLCKYTHSASLEHMSGINALSHFPSFDEAAFTGWISVAKICMSAMATVSLLGSPALYQGAHFTAKELIDSLLPQSERLSLLGGKKS